MPQADVLAWLQGLAGRDWLATRLGLVAWVNALLRPDGLSTVVVGGTAVDYYVSGTLGTSEGVPRAWRESLDIDTIVLRGLHGEAPAKAARLLEAHGFERYTAGSSVRHPALQIAIDLVGHGLPDDYSVDHVVSVYNEDWEARDLGPVVLVGPEDLAFDYIESGWDTRHPRDWVRALTILGVVGDELDLGYLLTKAHWRLDGAFVAPLEAALLGKPLQV